VLCMLLGYVRQGNYVLEELDTGEYQVVRYEDKLAKKPSPTRARQADT